MLFMIHDRVTSLETSPYCNSNSLGNFTNTSILTINKHNKRHSKEYYFGGQGTTQHKQTQGLNSRKTWITLDNLQLIVKFIN